MTTEPEPELEPSSDAKDFFKNMKGSVKESLKEIAKDPDKTEPDLENLLIKEEVVLDDQNPFDKPLPPKEVKTKEDNIAALRKGRDEAVNNLKTFTELFGEVKPEVVKPIFELITESIGGPLTADSVSEVLSQFKESKKRIEELEIALAENDKMVTDIDVRYSSEFKEKFERPYKEAMDGLFADFANTSEGKILAPESTRQFHEFLTSDPNLNHLQVKEALQKFVKSYKSEIGEDPLVPSMTSLMTSLRTFNNNRLKMKDAYENWKEVKQKTLEESTLQQQESDSIKKKSGKKTRVQIATKAWNEFDVSELEGIATEDEVQAMFKEEFNINEDLLDGKNVPSWDSHLNKGVHAQLWNKHKKEFLELKQWKKDQEDNERSTLSGVDSISKKSNSGEKHWLHR